MNNLYLKYCFQQQIPLPEVFQYLSKKDTPEWESENPTKQQALKSYLRLYTLNFHLKNDLTDHEEYYEKPTLFKGLVNVIYSKKQSLGCRLSYFMKEYDKLVKLFKEWHDNDTIALIASMKSSFDIELSKKKYIKKLSTGQKNIILQVLQSCIQKEDPVFEALNALKIFGSQFELIQDDRLTYALQQKAPCLLFNEKQGLNEQKIILEMVQIIGKNKNKFLNKLSTINSQYLLETQDLELKSNLKQIFQESLSQHLQEETGQQVLQSGNIKQALCKDITRKIFRIYIQHIFENKIPTPEIILSVQFAKFKHNFVMCPSIEFLFLMNKLESFQKFNKQLYLKEFIFLWCNSVSDLQWLKIYLDEKFSTKSTVPSQQRPQEILENFQQSYDRRQELRDRIIEVFHCGKVKWLINLFPKKSPVLKEANTETIELIIKLRDFAMNHIQHNIDKNSILFRIQGLKKVVHKKLINKLIQGERKYQIEENLRNFVKYLTSINYPVTELLRYYKAYKYDYSSGRIKLDITHELLQYLEGNTEIKGLLKQFRSKNAQQSMSPISIFDFKLEQQNIDQSNLLTESDVLISMLFLIEQNKEKNREQLINIFKAPQFQLFYLELQDAEFIMSSRVTMLNKALHLVNKLEKFLSQQLG